MKTYDIFKALLITTIAGLFISVAFDARDMAGLCAISSFIFAVMWALTYDVYMKNL